MLDLDATDDPVHGNQEGRFFHGYYGQYCYLPLYIFAGEFLLCARLRLSETVRQFTRERFNGDDDAGGKSVRGNRHAVVHRGPEDVARKSACATWIQFDAAYRVVRQ